MRHRRRALCARIPFHPRCRISRQSATNSDQDQPDAMSRQSNWSRHLHVQAHCQPTHSLVAKTSTDANRSICPSGSHEPANCRSIAPRWLEKDSRCFRAVNGCNLGRPGNEKPCEELAACPKLTVLRAWSRPSGACHRNPSRDRDDLCGRAAFRILPRLDERLEWRRKAAINTNCW